LPEDIFRSERTIINDNTSKTQKLLDRKEIFTQFLFRFDFINEQFGGQ
jgi:hypothetical protein